MPVHNTVKLNTGAEIPTLGLGTWQSKPGAVEKAVEVALKNGYTHIDTAAAYKNEGEVGQGIKASGVARGDFFLVTKLDNPDQKHAEQALFDSLKKLDTDYLDLWLMHWPAPMIDNSTADKSVDWLDTWKEMERLYKQYPEKIKAIGVSNFSVKFLDRLFTVATITPAVNQIELHPGCPQQDVVDYCIAKGIALTAYSPLGSTDSPLLANPVVVKLAESKGVPVANLLVSLQANRPNVTVLAKSVTPERIIANKTLVDLTEAEIAELHEIDKTAHFRVCHPSWTGWGSLGFPDCE